jgi:hypothetical protein
MNPSAAPSAPKSMPASQKFAIGCASIIGIIFFIGIIAALFSDDTEGVAQEPVQNVQVGEVLRTEYFDVTVSKIYIDDNVNTGNSFSSLKKENGAVYLILTTTFKNIDNESRMIDDGSVFINYNGKEYEYDHAEPIMAEGWGIMLDQINPLTSKSTNIVYKIPKEIKGPAFYEPGRNSDSKRIYLGNID